MTVLPPPAPIDLSALRKALSTLDEARLLWQAQPQGSVLRPHLRSSVIQSFEYTYELAVRGLRRVLIERATGADAVVDLGFNDLLRAAADAGLLPDALSWRTWRALRNATSHAYDESKAEAVAAQACAFSAEAHTLLQALERAA